MYDLIAGDTGTLFSFTIFETDGQTIIDLTHATDAILFVKFPDGITVQCHPCSIATPGTLGLVTYINDEGDFPYPGTYLLQVRLKFGSQVFNSRLITFRVGNVIIPVTPIC